MITGLCEVENGWRWSGEQGKIQRMEDCLLESDVVYLMQQIMWTWVLFELQIHGLLNITKNRNAVSFVNSFRKIKPNFKKKKRKKLQNNNGHSSGIWRWNMPSFKVLWAIKVNAQIPKHTVSTHVTIKSYFVYYTVYIYGYFFSVLHSLHSPKGLCWLNHSSGCISSLKSCIHVLRQ